MKKVFLFAIAAVAISFASCSNGASNKTEGTTADSTAVAQPEVVVNETETLAADSIGDTIAVGEISVQEVPAGK